MRGTGDGRLVAGGVHTDDEQSGGGQAVGVAQYVGDGFDPGEPDVGGVAHMAAEVVGGAVCWGEDLGDAERVAVGIEVVAGHEGNDRCPRIRTRHIITGHGCLVGVAGGEDADLHA